MRLPRALYVIVVTGTTAASAASCSSSDSPAAQVAQRFANAVDASGAAAACSYLAPATKSALEQSAGKPCPAALLEEHLPHAGAVRSSATYGTMAQVHLSGDTYFLSRFHDRWRVMAAGCTPRKGQHPYNCLLQGG